MTTRQRTLPVRPRRRKHFTLRIIKLKRGYRAEAFDGEKPLGALDGSKTSALDWLKACHAQILKDNPGPVWFTVHVPWGYRPCKEFRDWPET